MQLVEADPSFFALAGDGLYYLTPPGDSLHINVWRYDLVQQEAALVRNIRCVHCISLIDGGLPCRPMSRRFILARVDRSESDLMLTEGRI